MRFAIAAALLALASSAPAHAEVLSVSAQGQLALDRVGPLDGYGTGVRAGVQVLLIEGYWDYLTDLDGSSVRRIILGARGGADLWRFSIMGRLGIGSIRIAEDLPGPEEAARSGIAARAGAAVEFHLPYRLRLGLAVDAEASYFLTGQDLVIGGEISDFRAGSVRLLYLRVHFGI